MARPASPPPTAVTATVRALCVCVALALFGCASETNRTHTPARAPDADAPAEFAFTTSDGEVVDAAWARGRTTIVLFIATYDLASQYVARRVNELLASRKPRLNALGIVVEPPKYAPLVPAFKESLGLRYPCALVNAHSLSRSNGLGPIQIVPTLLILDRQGRIRWRHEGPLRADQLERALDEVEDRS